MLGTFYSQGKAIDMVEKSSSTSSSGIDEALEGEPIITWTCAVLKECLRSQGGRLTGKKEYLVWRQIVHLVTRGLSVISTESLPLLVFTELSSVTKPPRLQRHWKSSVSGRSEAGTTRQRSRTTALARVHRLHRLSYESSILRLSRALQTTSVASAPQDVSGLSVG